MGALEPQERPLSQKEPSMKNLTNVLIVLFMIAGIGLVYAGKGICETPETTYEVDTFHSFYPSGCLMVASDTTTTTHYNSYCEGEEGDCTVIYDPGALKTTIVIEWREYEDSWDNIIKDYGTIYDSTKGRNVCL